MDLVWFSWSFTGHARLGAHQDSQALFCQASFQLGSPWCVLLPGVVPPQVQALLLLLVELHTVPGSTFLQPVLVTLDGSMTAGVSATPSSSAASANLLRVHHPHNL